MPSKPITGRPSTVSLRSMSRVATATASQPIVSVAASATKGGPSGANKKVNPEPVSSFTSATAPS